MRRYVIIGNGAAGITAAEELRRRDPAAGRALLMATWDTENADDRAALLGTLDIGLTTDQIRDNLMFASDKVGATMTVALSAQEGKKWFGVAPPDLTVVARARGADWPVQVSNCRAPCATSISSPEIVTRPRPRASERKRVSTG